MVAARIAEVVMGRRFEVLLRDELLEPLGMRRTTFFPTAETLAQTPGRFQSTPSGTKPDPRMPLPKSGGLINPAGGLCSCLDDMTAFVRLHLNRGRAGTKQLIAAKSLERMYRPHPPRATETADGGGSGYGLGLNVMASGIAVRHLGASGTMLWIDVKNEHAGVLLTQVKWGPTNRPLIPKLMTQVREILG
jgi:CubicO group peptidase (beta-lactamase class C family)